MHSARVSLQEELESIDWYCQRAEACSDAQLKSILVHNLREEMEHSAMLIEWLRRKNSDFEGHLQSYVLSDAPITEKDEAATGRTRSDASRTPTIGSLKE